MDYACALKPDGQLKYVAQPNGLLAYTTSPQRCPSMAAYAVVVPGAQSPVLAGVEVAPLRYTAGRPPAPVTASLTVRSPSSATLNGATVRISAGLAAADSLGFTRQHGISGRYQAPSGTLTLTGTASSADYQAALRSVSYRDSDPEAASSARTISFQVRDGERERAVSNTVSRDIAVSRVGPPVAVDDHATTGKHAAVTIDVLANDTDPAGRPLTVRSVDTAGTKGMVTVNSNGTVSYHPHGQFAGLLKGQTAADTFTYRATDGFQTSNAATVTVTITGADDAPVLSGVETTPLGYQAGSAPVAVTSTLTVSDDDAGTISSAMASLTAGLGPGVDTLSFANQDGITGSYNASQGVLRLSGPASPADYQAALRSVEFATSDPSASPAARTVSFTVADSTGTSSAPASRTIDVSSAAEPPNVVNQAYSAVGNTPLAVGTTVTGPAATLSGSVLNGDTDSDPSATLSAAEVSPPAHGTLTLNPDGTFTYLPAVGFSGTDSFQIAVAGSNAPSLTSTATVTITVGTLVWYVNSAAPDGYGNGSAGSPFADLAAAVGQGGTAGANSVVFLYQGSYAVLHVGVMMRPGEDLYGQPHGLTVGGYQLVAPGGSAPTIDNLTADGIDLAEGVDVEGVDVDDPIVNGIVADDVNSATVGVTTPVAVLGAGAGISVDVNGGDGQLDFGDTTVSATRGDSVSVTGRSGGTVSFGGAISNSAAGIVLNDNPGAAVNFTGPLDLTAYSTPAFSATGGGTVTATGPGSTITTTTGTAVNVQNTSIGGAGLTFQSVSSDGAEPGIELVSTGTSGGLTVSGTGPAGSGGQIEDSAGDGIELTSTYAPSLADMRIEGNDGDGIDASGVTGALSVTGSTFAGNLGHSVKIDDASGTLTGTIAGNAIGSATAANSGGGVGLAISAEGTAAQTLVITGNDFYQYSSAAGISFLDHQGDPAMNLTITGNTLADPGAHAGWGILGTDGELTGDAGTVCAAISGNSIRGAGQQSLGGSDIQLDQNYGTTIELPGYAGGSGDVGAVASYLEASNSGNGTPIAGADVSGSGGGFVGGSSC